MISPIPKKNCGIEVIQINLFITQTHRLMVTRGKGEGRESLGVWDGHVHTAIFKMNNQNPWLIHVNV